MLSFDALQVTCFSSHVTQKVWKLGSPKESFLLTQMETI